MERNLRSGKLGWFDSNEKKNKNNKEKINKALWGHMGRGDFWINTKINKNYKGLNYSHRRERCFSLPFSGHCIAFGSR